MERYSWHETTSTIACMHAMLFVTHCMPVAHSAMHDPTPGAGCPVAAAALTAVDGCKGIRALFDSGHIFPLNVCDYHVHRL
jgi:hypothetical protein